jgi:chromate reductase, NAD(P)H dehydrogenase (quinone)
MSAVRILGVCGSLRHGSHNAALLRAVAQAPPPGARFELYDGLRLVPPFDQDLEAALAPAAVTDLVKRVAAADALLIATPEYNFSIPGQLKNALDWLSRPPHASVLARKPVAVVGASTGMFGAVWAQSDLRKVLGATGAAVLECEFPLARAAQAFAPDGSLLDAQDRARLARVVARLLARAREQQQLAA